MDAPYCRSCQKRHYGSCVEASRPTRETPQQAPEPESNPKSEPTQAASKSVQRSPGAERQALYRERNREAYNARERERMRRRRQQKKEESRGGFSENSGGQGSSKGSER